MVYDCHIHMILDGVDWKRAIAAHRHAPDDRFIRQRLAAYRAAGITYLRDGGDRWGVCRRAAELAPEYGICYRAPLCPIYQKGRYGALLGRSYETLAEFRQLVDWVGQGGGHFIKIMISGLMDFNQYGVLTDPPMEPAHIRDLVAIAHDAGFSVMAHCNGAGTILAAVTAGVDSLEHGAYLDETAAQALARSDTVWVPTLSAVGNLIGTGRYPDAVLRRILAHQMQMVRRVSQLGGHIACGSDAGAYRVEHVQGAETEAQYLAKALDTAQWQQHLMQSCQMLQKKF